MRTREAAEAAGMPTDQLIRWYSRRVVSKVRLGSGCPLEWSANEVRTLRAMWVLHSHLSAGADQHGRLYPMLRKVAVLLAGGRSERWLYVDALGPLLVGDEGLSDFLAGASGAFHLIDLHKVAA